MAVMMLKNISLAAAMMMMLRNEILAGGASFTQRADE
jgi:hypothetical protein